MFWAPVCAECHYRFADRAGAAVGLVDPLGRNKDLPLSVTLALWATGRVSTPSKYLSWFGSFLHLIACLFTFSLLCDVIIKTKRHAHSNY